MLEITVTFLILIALLPFPLWVYYRMTVSKETRSHLNALLLHDIIRIVLRAIGKLITGALRLIRRIFASMATSIRSLFGS